MTHTTTTPTILAEVPTGLWIGGRSVDADSGETFAVENPANGEILCRVADAREAESLRALDAAASAQEAWAATTPRERSEILRRAYDMIVARTDEIAELITLEMGKSVAESRGEVAYGADFLRWFSEEAVRITGTFGANPTGPGRIATIRQPVGPCLLITPWNVPLAMATRKVGPALAAGCTVVLKPAAQTPLTSLLFARIMREAGLPDGVLNVVTTTRPETVSVPLMSDPRLRKVSFTGSTPVGRLLLRTAADQVLRTSMELGGNAPFIVCADADLDAAVKGALIAKMRNVGEACIAANRFYVHEDVADEFVDRLVTALSQLQVGDGMEPGTDVGPLIDGTQRAKVAALVDDAVAHGATVALGGTVPDAPGYFYPPTVLQNVSPECRMSSEEIFGPVAPVTTFRDDAEALRLANATEFGLVSYVFTQDFTRALWFSEKLESGMVGLNRGFISNAAAPFGGVKQSGLGREGGAEGIAEYLETKYIAMGPE
ncbi:NAD-dependent succinate-semialdehyde dehydrogenase [Microbacterium sp. RD1]|uniref:NAD-dependent succinate-semialdehyde dehydrogenase n=1 Tax=Microbacterium sp. RD1 TaxID=3457313 RepID=UPI003FA5CA21